MHQCNISSQQVSMLCRIGYKITNLLVSLPWNAVYIVFTVLQHSVSNHFHGSELITKLLPALTTGESELQMQKIHGKIKRNENSSFKASVGINRSAWK